ncbi:MAG: sugar transferase, partial [Terriglobales bacterium]
MAIRGQLPGLRGPMNLPTVAACLAILCAAIAADIVAPRLRSASAAPRALALVPAAAIAVLMVLFFFRSYGNAVSRPTILFFALLATAVLTAWEGFGRHWLPRAAPVRNLILVGGEGQGVGSAFAQGLDAGPWRIAERFETDAVAGSRSDATLDRLQQLVRQEPIDEILIADSIWEAGPEARRFFRGVGDLCEQTGVRLHVYAQWLSGCRRVHMDYLGDCPIMTFSFCVASPWLLAIKRAADLGASALLLAVLSPLLAVIAAAVVLDSPGPALFSQVRCGLRGRSFRIYKFRSMVADAEERRAALV